MGKTTIYLNKEAEQIYARLKEYAGDNLSAAIVQALKVYLDKLESQAKGMQEVIIFEGKYFLDMDMTQGKNLRFFGMLLGSGKSDYGHGLGYEHEYKLYLTRKGKFLVSGVYVDPTECAEICFYKIFDSFSEVMAAGYPEKLLKEAREKMPEVACEELDV